MGMPSVSAEDKSNSIAYLISPRAALDVRNWKWIYEGCQNIKKEAMKVGYSHGAGLELPPSYERALGYLRLQLEQELKDTQHSIESAMWKSPAFQHNFRCKVYSMDEIPVQYRTVNMPLEHWMRIVLKAPQNLY